MQTLRLKLINMQTTKISILAALLSFSLGIAAQRIKVETALVDVGQVKYCRPATAVFDLRNAGKRPLTISKVDTGCNCSVADFPKAAIASGDKFQIKITYDARQMGHFDKIIEVYGNANDDPATLEMRGVVVDEPVDYAGSYPFMLGDLSADCNAVSFDDVFEGETLTQRFHIFNPTSKTVNPQIMHLPAYLQAEISPSAVAPGHSAEVTLTLDSRMMRDYGYEKTHVYLGANPGERVAPSKEISVAVTLLPAASELSEAELKYAPSIQLSSQTLSLPAADGKKRTAVVDVQNTGKTALEIYSLRVISEGIEVSLSRRTLAPAETAKLKIKTNPKQLPADGRMRRIVLITNDPQQPKVTLDIDTN